MQESLFCIN